MKVKLNELMKTGAWLVDGDGDGLPDGLDVTMIIADGLDTDVYLAAAQLAARLGLEVAALTLPVCCVDTESGSLDQSGWRIIVGGANRQMPTATILPPLNPDQARAVLCGRDLLIEGADRGMAHLLRHFAANIPGELPEAGSDALVVNEEELVWWGHSLVVQHSPLAKLANASTQPECLLSCLSKLYSIDGLFTDHDGDCLPDNWRFKVLPVAQNVQEWAAIINLAARWGLETLGLTFSDGQNSDANPLVVVDQQESRSGIWLRDGRVELVGNAQQRIGAWRYLAEEYPDTQVSISWMGLALYLEGLARETSVDGEWQEIGLEWEVDDVKQLWRQLVRQADGYLAAEVRVSESLDIRQQLAADLTELARAEGVHSELVVRCAYKQGLHWIREEVVPVLQALGPIDRIRIEVAPFRTPNALDPGARWLLELYPVDQVLANSLGIDPGQVAFELNPGLENTYRFSAWSQDELLVTTVYDVWHVSQPYLPLLANQPKVHPPTGGIKLGGSDMKRIPTDGERVFAAYQAEILPALLDSVAGVGGLDVSNQPFFERLEIEVTCSEPEELLGVREEMVSVADALHEDIYFVGLDLFKRLGEQTGQVLRAPGLILPDIRVCHGVQPRMRYRIVPKRADQAVSRPRLTAISLSGSGVDGSEWEWEMPSQGEALRVSKLLQTVDQSGGLAVRAILRFPGGSLPVETRLRPTIPQPEVQRTEDEVVYLQECRQRLDQLSKRAPMQVELAGVSRQGRHVYSIAATSKAAGKIVSVTKCAGWKPTWLLNNRHHANEVSSTSAALDLMQSLADDAAMSAVLNRINVVCIPMENVDGAAIHQQLAKANPRHKLHAARFNSQGREFADAYFRDDPTVPEARALPDVWRRWVPDVVVDNHGIPSHEWEQPFSGYICPWFASFWIPRSLFYAYFWLASGQGQASRTAAEGLEQAVTARLVADPDINRRNQELLASWRKYFVPHLDDHFAGEERGGIMWYYVPYQTPQGRFSSHRWPNLTVLDWTTEVADETARGDYLDMCSRAHRIAQEACLHWLASQPVTLEQIVEPVRDGTYRKRSRQRPLIPKGADE